MGGGLGGDPKITDAREHVGVIERGHRGQRRQVDPAVQGQLEHAARRGHNRVGAHFVLVEERLRVQVRNTPDAKLHAPAELHR